MAYPLIILGAGASYDVLDETQYDELSGHYGELHKYRPPLTNSIFEVRKFSEIMDKHPEVSALARYVNAVVPGQLSFEQVLSEIETKIVNNNEDRHKWIMALRFYLVDLFNIVTQKSLRRINNYGVLIDHIGHTAQRKALVVNFNYDLLFESNIKEIIESREVNAYIGQNIKIIKIHGAYNWSYPIQTIIDTEDSVNAYKFCIENASSISKQKMQNLRYIINPPGWEYEHRIGDWNKQLYLPAVAIPASHKNDLFVCPDAHIQELINILPSVDRVLIIGWKAGDPFLLDLLRRYIPNPVPTWVVSKNTIPDEINKRFKNIPNLKISGLFVNGFNYFIRQNRVQDFLSFQSS